MNKEISKTLDFCKCNSCGHEFNFFYRTKEIDAFGCFTDTPGDVYRKCPKCDSGAISVLKNNVVINE